MEARCQERAVDVYKQTEDAKRVTFNREKAEREASIASRGECDVHFNFNDPNITVFSVERVKHNTEEERTVIGYYVSEALDEKGGEADTGAMISIRTSNGPSGPYATGVVDTKGVAGSGNLTLKKIKEWTLLCSRGQHNKLVAQFEASRNTYKGQETAKKQLLQG